MEANVLTLIKRRITESLALKEAILSDEQLLGIIARVADLALTAYRRGHRLILAGNGGSAADAQHIAAEFVSRFAFDRPGLPALAITTDTSMLTAIGNDYGYDRLFVRQLEANGRAGDVFIGISTSGSSPNILSALQRCRSLGITAIGLSGAAGRISDFCDLCIRVPSTCTPRIQESHIMIGHIICELIESTMFPEQAK